MTEKRLAPDGESPPGAEVGRLERKPQGELDQAWKVVRAAHSPKACASTTVGIGRVKLRSVEAVEELCPELSAEPFIRTKLGVLEEGKVKVLHAVVPDVRLGTRIGAVAEVRTVRIHRRVKPFSEPLIQRTGSHVRHTSSRWAGTPRVYYAGVAEEARAPTDDNREAALEGDDGINPPSADELIGNSAQVTGKVPAFAKGQVQNGTEHQALGQVKGVQATLLGNAVSIRTRPTHLKRCRQLGSIT